MHRISSLLTAAGMILLCSLPVQARAAQEEVIELPCTYAYPYHVGTVAIHFDREMPGTHFRLLRMQEEGNFPYFSYDTTMPACPTTLLCNTIEGDYLLEVVTPSDSQESPDVLSFHLSIADPDMEPSVTSTRIDYWFTVDPELEEHRTQSDTPENRDGIVEGQTVCLIARRSCAPGDLDGSGVVNATDASVLLRSAAAVVARRSPGIDSLRQAEADLDMNGTFNANDASLLLRYAALFGSSNFTGTIEDYIHR